VSPYREDREPCRECARREVEKKLTPKAPWKPPVWLLPVLGGVVAALFFTLITHLNNYEERHRGEIDNRCKPDGTCIANLVCRTKDDGYSYLYCLPSQGKAAP
jgi:hypothetical protein